MLNVMIRPLLPLLLLGAAARADRPPARTLVDATGECAAENAAVEACGMETLDKFRCGLCQATAADVDLDALLSGTFDPVCGGVTEGRYCVDVEECIREKCPEACRGPMRELSECTVRALCDADCPEVVPDPAIEAEDEPTDEPATEDEATDLQDALEDIAGDAFDFLESLADGIGVPCSDERIAFETCDRGSDPTALDLAACEACQWTAIENGTVSPDVVDFDALGDSVCDGTTADGYCDVLGECIVANCPVDCRAPMRALAGCNVERVCGGTCFAAERGTNVTEAGSDGNSFEEALSSLGDALSETFENLQDGFEDAFSSIIPCADEKTALDSCLPESESGNAEYADCGACLATAMGMDANSLDSIDLDALGGGMCDELKSGSYCTDLERCISDNCPEACRDPISDMTDCYVSSLFNCDVDCEASATANDAQDVEFIKEGDNSGNGISRSSMLVTAAILIGVALV